MKLNRDIQDFVRKFVILNGNGANKHLPSFLSILIQLECVLKNFVGHVGWNFLSSVIGKIGRKLVPKCAEVFYLEEDSVEKTVLDGKVVQHRRNFLSELQPNIRIGDWLFFSATTSLAYFVDSCAGILRLTTSNLSHISPNFALNYQTEERFALLAIRKQIAMVIKQ